MNASSPLPIQQVASAGATKRHTWIPTPTKYQHDLDCSVSMDGHEFPAGTVRAYWSVEWGYPEYRRGEPGTWEPGQGDIVMFEGAAVVDQDGRVEPLGKADWRRHFAERWVEANDEWCAERAREQREGCR